MVEPMNSQDLVLRALQGLAVPRTPVGPLAVHWCAGFSGYSMREYTTRAASLADAVLRYAERFRPDAVWLSADTWVSAEAMGAAVGAPAEGQPFGGVGGPLVQVSADIARLPPPEIGRQGRYPLMLEALGRIRAAVGRELCVVACFDQYPFSLAAALMGINEIMVRVVDDPAFVEALMARCAEYAVAYGRALAEAGADVLSGGDSPAGLLGPELYARVARPYERAVIAGLKATGRPVSLHLCGNATPLLPAMAGSGADVLELDHAVDLAEACRLVGPEIAIWGNLDPVRVLAHGTPAEVTQAARAALAAAAQSGQRRFVLSSGCTLAVGTPPANLDALIDASYAAADLPRPRLTKSRLNAMS